MSAHVCKIFDNLYKQLPDEDNKEKQIVVDNLLYEAFCPTNENSYGKCISDCDRISAGFGYLLVQLFENVESENEHEDQEDKYVYYGLMWASYKLQQLNKNRDKPISLNEFFTNNIVKGQWYEIIKEHIEPKKSLLNNDINIEYMSDIYYIFKETCKIFSNDSSDLDHLEDFSSYYQSIISCGEKLKKRSNNGDTDTNDSSCNTLYDMLNHVYDDFRKDYFKNKPTNDSLPDLPDFKKIKEPSKPDLGISDSQDSIDKKPETQDGDSQNSDSVTNNEHINSTNNLEQQQNEEPTEGTISNIVLDGSTVPEYEFTITSYKPHDFIDGVEVPDIEAEYFDAQDEFLYIDTDLSHSVIEPKYMYFSHPDLDIEQNNLDIEQNDLDNEQTDFYNQPQPHQINTLKFDDPFKHPENFSDSIMCKLHGPKSVYCNRIICNRIKIGVIALSIPIALVFAYKYFPWKRKKKPKKTKKMKRVVNLLDRKKTKKIDISSIDDKKTIQTIINSNDKKKATKRIINSNDKKKATKRNIHSDNGKTTLLFNIYKQVQLNPMPFIHLFMLLIFFIFKRKKDSIE